MPKSRQMNSTSDVKGMGMNEGLIGNGENRTDGTKQTQKSEEYYTKTYGGDNKYDTLNQIQSPSTNTTQNSQTIGISKTGKGGVVDGIQMSQATTNAEEES